MSVLDRASLEQSPLADLHTIASELSIDSYRRLRKEELIDAILSRQGGQEEPRGEEAEEPPAPRRRRTRRGGKGRGSDEAPGAEAARAEVEKEVEQPGEPRKPEDDLAEGVVELLPGGSAFVRISPPEHSDDDVYISAAQVRRCELVSGDRVSGPRRPPRRSERYASLVRVDTINGQPAAELADKVRFEDLTAAFPDQPYRFDSEDPTIKLIAERLPIGRGSRVTIVGERQSGKTETLRRLAIALAGQEGVDVWLVLVGVRPEELAEWRAGPVDPVAALSFASSPDAQGQTVDSVLDQARRLAARGGNVVLLIDTLEGLPAPVRRRVLAAARNIADGGSLTVIATSAAALGGETSAIALDPLLVRGGKFPAIDLDASWIMRGEQLAPEDG